MDVCIYASKPNGGVMVCADRRLGIGAIDRVTVAQEAGQGSMFGKASADCRFVGLCR